MGYQQPTVRENLIETVITKSSATAIVNVLESNGFHAVRLTSSDCAGGTRLRVVPVAYFAKLIEGGRSADSNESKPHVTTATLGLVFSTLAEGFSCMGENYFVLDLRSLRVCSYVPGHISVHGCHEYKRPMLFKGLREATLEVEQCLRTALKRVTRQVREAKAVSNIEFLIGFEIEFTLLKSKTPPVAVNSYPYGCSRGTAAGTDELDVLEEIVKCLKTDEIEVQMYHSEGAPGQFEIVTGPLPPLEAVDALLATRETIYNVAKAHKLHATLAPKVFRHELGSGAHAHISLQPPSRSKEMSSAEKSFLAGILEHLPALSFITLPVNGSYARTGDGIFSGGTWACWGEDNREAPLRVCNASEPKSRNFEYRIMDGIANPYLAMAAILDCGINGIKTNSVLGPSCGGLDESGKPRESAAALSAEERNTLGIDTPLPMSLDNARASFEKDEVIKDILGEAMCGGYLSISKTLSESLSTGKGEEADLDLMIEVY